MRLRLPKFGLGSSHRTLILIGALIVMVFGALLLQTIRHHVAEERLHRVQNAQDLAGLYARMLVTPVSALDRKKARERLDVIVDVGMPLGIQVHLPSGDVFAQSRSNISHTEASITVTSPITRGSHTIGTVTLTVKTEDVSRLEFLLSGQAIVQFSILFAVVILGLLIAFRAILAPIDRISSQILRLAGGDHDIDIPETLPSDEFGKIWNAVRVLRDNAITRGKTEAALAERATELSEAQEILWEAVECSAEAFSLWDTDMTLLMCNSNYRALFPKTEDIVAPGLTYGDYVKIGFEREIFTVPEGMSVEEAQAEMIARHLKARGSSEHKLGDGRWIRVAKRNTDTGRVVTVLTDITERKRAEDVLRNAEESYRTLFEQSPISMLIQDGRRILFANPAAAQLYGVETPDDLLGIEALDLIHPEDREERQKRWQTILEDGATRSLHEHRHLRRDGSEIFVASKGIPFEWQGKPAILGVFIDLTDRQKAQKDSRENEKRYRSLFEASPAGMLVQDENKILFANPAAAALYGAKDHLSLVGVEPSLLIHADEYDEWLKRRDRLLIQREETPLVEQRRITCDGKEIIVATKGIPIDWQGKKAILGVTLDITESRKAQAELAVRAGELAEAREVLWDAVANISEGFALWDADGKLLICNENYRALFPHLEFMLVPGARYNTFVREAVRRGIFPMEDGETLNAAANKLIEHHKNPGPPVEQLLGNGEWTRESKTVTATGRVVSIISTITERKLAEATIRQMALHDALTGLPNRSEFQRRLTEAIESANRMEHSVGIMLLDLDNFKTVNDTLGHPVGDELLKLAAARINECVRRSDTVARLGGDEFAVIVTNSASPDGIVVLGQRIVNALAQPFDIGGSFIHTGTSIGITIYPNDYGDTDELLRNADVALYKAKEDGRGICRLYDESMNQAVIQRQLLEEDLRLAIENQEFHLRYQPQIDIATGRVIGAEALIRWTQPNGESISPADFIPVAESTHLIIPIGAWVLDEACAQMKRWRDKNMPLISVSVNISPRQFKQSDLLEQVEYALDKYDLKPDCLELEITEGMAMSGGEDMLAILNRLNALGVQLAIDDFGQGYSSLAYLKRFPVDRLKIDKSFVEDITTDWNDAAICSAIIQLGHNLQLKVIAEGVETLDQATHLIDKDCDEVQGYLFGAPMTAHEFELFMHTYDPRELQRKLSLTEPVPNLRAAI